MTTPTIDQALADQRLLGGALGDLGSWGTWLVVLKAAFGLSLDAAERTTFAKIAGGRPLPGRRVRELWAVVARRSGKSRMAAALAVFLSLFQWHKLAKGETGHVLVLAATAGQAQIVFQYCAGFIEGSEALRREVRAITAHEIRLANGVIIGVHVNSYRTIRGKTLLACIFDETAFWRDESSALPDVETYPTSIDWVSGPVDPAVTVEAERSFLQMRFQQHLHQRGGYYRRVW